MVDRMFSSNLEGYLHTYTGLSTKPDEAIGTVYVAHVKLLKERPAVKNMIGYVGYRGLGSKR